MNHWCTGSGAIVALMLLACSPSDRTAERPAPGAAPAADSAAAKPSFVNRVWEVSQSTSVAPGHLYVFLSEGTLVIASPFGTPSLGKWTDEAGVLTIMEEGLPYRWEVIELTKSSFRIRVHNPGESVEIQFVPAEGPAAPRSGG